MDDKSRRTFLKVAGAAIIGGVGAPVVAAFARTNAPPARGKRLALVVDPKRCLRHEGCRACIDACHGAHNVPDLSNPYYGLSGDDLAKREVKWVWKEPYEHAFPDEQHELVQESLANKDVLVLCNHCDRPACVKVCPTGATWKRESDGIVMMDMHRCVGCRYCVVACPYGSRSFNWREPWPRPFEKHLTPPNPSFPTRTRGVVEKCNFCSDRLAKDSNAQPACVEACPGGALVFGDLREPGSEVVRLLKAHHALRRKPGLGTSPQVYYIV